MGRDFPGFYFYFFPIQVWFGLEWCSISLVFSVVWTRKSRGGEPADEADDSMISMLQIWKQTEWKINLYNSNKSVVLSPLAATYYLGISSCLFLKTSIAKKHGGTGQKKGKPMKNIIINFYIYLNLFFFF